MKFVHTNHFLGDEFVMTLPFSTIRDPRDRIAVGLGLGELHRRRRRRSRAHCGAEVLAQKHESRILGQWSNPVSGFFKVDYVLFGRNFRPIRNR